MWTYAFQFVQVSVLFECFQIQINITDVFLFCCFPMLIQNCRHDIASKQTSVKKLPGNVMEFMNQIVFWYKQTEYCIKALMLQAI